METKHSEPRTVLIIDDERDFSISLQDILQSRNYSVQLAFTVQEAEQALPDTPASVCLVDIRLGRASGLDLVARIRETRPELLSVLMTAYADTETAIRALKEGAYDYLRKPFDAEELLATLERCFDKIRLQREKVLAQEALQTRNEELAQINSRLEQMVQAAAKLAACTNPRDLSKRLLEEFAYNMAVEGGSLFIHQEDRLVLAYSLDPDHVPVTIPLPVPGNTVLGIACSTRKPFLVKDIASQRQVMPSGWNGYKDGSLLVFPLLDRNGALMGLISLHNKRWPPFTQQDIDMGLVLISLSMEILRSLRTLGELAESREHFRELIENSLDMIILLESNGSIRYASPAVQRVMGYLPGAVTGRSVYSLVHPEDAEKLRWKLAELAAQPAGIVQGPVRVRHKDGSWRMLESVAKNALDSLAVRGIVVNTRDVTDRHTAEQALRESESKYRYLFAHSYALNLVIGVDGRILESSGLPGYTEAEVIGHPAVDFVVPEDRQRAASLIEMELYGQGSNGPGGVEIRFRAADGAVRTALFVGGPPTFVYQGERRIGVLVTGMDITERKAAEAREREHEQQLLQAAKLVSLGTLVSGVAHEISNPNNFIRLITQSLRDVWSDIERTLDDQAREARLQISGMPYDKLKGSVQDMLRGLEEGSRRIERLVKSLKDYARKDPGELTEVVHLRAVVDRSAEIIRSLIKRSTDRFLCEVEESVPPILGNANQLEQVLINLITNACQALPSRDREVRVHIEHDRSCGQVVIRVKDQGQGIPAEIIPQITDPFFTTKREQGGTGLGLSISQRIVQNHGGRMCFDSHPGEGTTVTVALPVRGSEKSGTISKAGQ